MDRPAHDWTRCESCLAQVRLAVHVMEAQIPREDRGEYAYRECLTAGIAACPTHGWHERDCGSVGGGWPHPASAHEEYPHAHGSWS